ncbi:TonB system transport protein ExbD [Paracoccus xiamenensis]|uniref:TonB system transport protein ExbD n=1 Tax=Paracoccus xiamenensis TaxID=2714901 RepID=UPI00140DABC1|nr:TonB system transport protein ExbD [Paracoccus xiamenensis]NHF73841.1 TonB system transport protein ExbD [Paracoccus xiamenensis]
MAGRLQDDDSLTDNHEINVTPFIDVMLVLLIIFMVAAPLATVDINIDLPASRGSASQRPDQPVWLTIAADRSLSLGQAQISSQALPAQLDAETGGNRETRIFLRADKAVSYGEVMEVMNLLRDHAYTKIALVGLDATAAPPATGAVDGQAVPAGAGQ